MSRPCYRKNHRASGFFLSACLTFAGLSAASTAQAEAVAPPPAATPYRPTIANPAELSAPGWLELEAGGVRSAAADARRLALPFTAKLAFNENWGVMLGSEIAVRDNSSGEWQRGRGDTTFTLKHRLAGPADTLNFGIEAGLKLATAKTGLGSGARDWNINGIASYDLAPDWRLDSNLGLTHPGAHDTGTGRYVGQWALALSHNLGPWTFAGELSGVRQSGAPGQQQRLLAVGYAATRQLVFDTGLTRSIRAGTVSHGAFLGLTWLAAQIF